jgi:lipopolysaccharide/colanic/teichoic acid biosynthesis glycosyltransferase
LDVALRERSATNIVQSSEMATVTPQISSAQAAKLGEELNVHLPRRLRTFMRDQGARMADCLSVGVATGAVIWSLGEGGAPTRTLAAVLAVALYHIGGGHRPAESRFARTTLDEIPRVLVLAGILSLILTIVTPTAGHRTLGGERTVVLWIALAVALALGRSLARTLSARLIGPERCLVVGTVMEARRIQRRFDAGGVNAWIIGVVGLEQMICDSDVVALQEALTTVTCDVGADRLIVSQVNQSQEDIASLVRVARLGGLRLSVCSPVLDAAGTNAQACHVAGMALLAADPIDGGVAAHWIRRIVDLALAATLLLLLSPVLALIALAVKLESPGPVLFRQTRVGRHGKLFRIFKFRSMVAGAELQKASLRQLSEVGSEMFKLTDDPRVTRIGRFLRKSSIDEFPQLFNVLHGDMTLVGPRPLVVEEDAAISGVGRGRLQRTPGMTGPWQVLHKRVAQPEMLEVDYGYVTNSTLWVDLKILVQTVLHVMRRANV